MAEFEARGTDIWQKPFKVENGTRMGFHVLTVDDHVVGAEQVAKTLAKLMSESPEFQDE